MVARKIFGIVLTLAIGIVGWLPKNMYTPAASAFIVSVHVLNSDHYRRFQRDAALGFDQNHCAIADV